MSKEITIEKKIVTTTVVTINGRDFHIEAVEENMKKLGRFQIPAMEIFNILYKDIDWCDKEDAIRTFSTLWQEHGVNAAAALRITECVCTQMLTPA